MFGRKARQQLIEIINERDEWRKRAWELLDEKLERKVCQVITDIPRLTTEEIRKQLVGQKNNPVFQAIMCLIRANQDLAVAAAAHDKQADVKPGYYDGALGMVLDIQNDVLKYESQEEEENKK